MSKWLDDARERLGYRPPISPFSDKLAFASYNEFFGPGGVFSEILKHCAFRKIMGAFRYEQKKNGMSYDDQARYGLERTYMQRALVKIAEYERTGNREMLADLVNYAALEWKRPYHPNSHFKSTERHE